MRTVGTKVLVHKLEETPSLTTKSGLIIPSSAIRENPDFIKAKVVSKGPACAEDLEIGSIIGFNRSRSSWFQEGTEEYYCLDTNDINVVF